jgi:hypothetical protein
MIWREKALTMSSRCVRSTLVSATGFTEESRVCLDFVRAVFNQIPFTTENWKNTARRKISQRSYAGKPSRGVGFDDADDGASLKHQAPKEK